MRLSRRRRAGKPSSMHLSLSATDAEWDAVRARAEARGLSVARYLVGLAERDGEAEPGPAMALSAEEQRDLLEAMRALRAMAAEPVPPVAGKTPPPGPAPRQGRLL